MDHACYKEQVIAEKYRRLPDGRILQGVALGYDIMHGVALRLLQVE